MQKQTDMRLSPQKLSRTNLIEQSVRAFIRETSVSMETYASNVREIYEATLPASQRTVYFNPAEDISDRRKRDAEKISRFLDNDKARFPVELEDALVLALPIERREVLEHELASRRGMICLVLKQVGGEVGSNEVLKELGEAVSATAAGSVEKQIKELDEAIAAARTRRDALKKSQEGV